MLATINDLFVDFVNKTNDLVYIVDSKGNLIFVNSSWTKKLGYTKKQVLGTPVLKYLHPDDLEHYRSVFDQFSEVNSDSSQELQFLSKKGAKISCKGSISCSYNAEGELENSIGIFEDVTDLRNVELLNRISYEIAVKASLSDLSVSEFCEFIQRQVGQLMDVTGFYISQLSDDNLIFLHGNGDTSRKSDPVTRRFGNGLSEYIIRTGKPLCLKGNETIQFQKDKGLEIYGEPAKCWIGAPLISAGKTIGVIACQSTVNENQYDHSHLELLKKVGGQIGLWIERKMATDALKESEGQLKSLMKNAPYLIMRIDDKHEIEYINRPENDYTYPNIVGSSIYSFVDPAEHDRVRSIINKVIKTGAATSFGTIARDRNNRKVIIQTSISPFKNSAGDITSVIAIIQDVTAEIRSKNEIEASYRELKLIDEINRASMEGQSPDELIKRTMKQVLNFSGATGGRFYVNDKENRKLILKYEYSENGILQKIHRETGIKASLIIPPIEEKNYFQQAILSRKMVVLNTREEILDVITQQLEEPALKKLASKIYSLVETKVFLIIPLVSDQKIFGLITLFSNKELKPEIIESISRFSNGITAALEKTMAVYETREQKQFTENVLNNLPADIAVFDNQHRYLYINPIAVLNEDTRSWLIGKDDFQYAEYKQINPHKAKERRKYFNQAKKSKTDVSWIEKSEKRGLEHYVLRQFHPVFEGKSLKYMLGYGVDITERVKAEKKNNELASIVQNSTDAIISTDLKGNIKSWNEGAHMLLGYTENEVIGKSVKIIVPKEKENETKELNREVTQNKKSITIETVRRTKSGQNVDVSLSIFPLFDADGKMNQASAILRDISSIKAAGKALRKSETLLKQTQKIAKLGSWEWDVKENTVYWSDELYDIFEVPLKNQQLTYETYIERVHPDDRERVDLVVQQAFAEKKRFSLSHGINTEDKKEKFVILIGNFELDNSGEVVRLYGACMDNTERAKAEKVRETFTQQLETQVLERTEKLLISQKRLKEALAKEKELGKLKSSFVSTASHQFRTPMAIIKSNTELLDMIIKSGQESNYAKLEKATARIRKEVSRMTDLMDEVLVLGKITSGALKPNIQPTDLMEVCTELINEYNLLQPDGRNVDFSVVGNPLSLELDPKLINNAISNLLSNAFKYSKKGNPKLTLHYEPSQVRLQIQDTGIGIPENDLPNLFQAFQRASNVQDISGTGLGLVIAKEYLEINRAIINVQSVINEGTLFSITFPVRH